ncbi:hypothetical protein [Kineococcus terrestris]|uniref:hypothetical protein n=1 Tax=Kineococcus terrestris TaxID=2044856 RepID=UPI0034DB37AB
MTGARWQRLDRAAAGFVEDFTGPRLDPGRWVEHYLPHWTTPERSRARYDLLADGPAGPGGLRLRVDADQPGWRPEDAPLRVSSLQTALFSGPAGSTRGTHRHRPDGLVVRTPTPLRLLWAPRAGQVDVTVTAGRDDGCTLAVWLVGTEHLDERDSGEVCLFEIDGEAVADSATTARTGVKAHHDPRLVTDVREVVVPVGAGTAHTWSARWDGGGVVVACEDEVVLTSPQVLRYPLQLVVSLFAVRPGARGSALVHEVVAT